MNKGKIVQIIGPVVDVEFPGRLPAIYDALTVEFSVPGGGKTRQTLEVEQHLGNNWVRCVCMGPTEGMKRGCEITDTGRPISMPVGEDVMGRVLNVVGETVDEQGPVKAAKFYEVTKQIVLTSHLVDGQIRKSTRLNSSHANVSRMPSSA